MNRDHTLGSIPRCQIDPPDAVGDRDDRVHPGVEYETVLQTRLAALQLDPRHNARHPGQSPTKRSQEVFRVEPQNQSIRLLSAKHAGEPPGVVKRCIAAQIGDAALNSQGRCLLRHHVVIAIEDDLMASPSQAIEKSGLGDLPTAPRTSRVVRGDAEPLFFHSGSVPGPAARFDAPALASTSPTATSTSSTARSRSRLKGRPSRSRPESLQRTTER